MAAAARKNMLLLVILVALLAAAGTLVQRWRAAQPEARAAAVPRQSGIVLADLAARHGSAQARILLVLPATAPGASLRDWLQIQRSTLEKEIPGGMKIIGTEPVAGGRGSHTPFTVTALATLAQKYPAANLIISLAGAPAPDAATKLPTLLCFAPEGEHVAALMQSGQLAAAIVPRNQRVPIEAADGAWYDVLYQVVTPASLAAWQSGNTRP
jgi:hypothetical protein